MERHDYTAPAGTLAVREFPGTAPAAVCLHGFTWHGGMFRILATHATHGLAAPDLPGHGASRIEPPNLAATVSTLAAWLESKRGPSVVLGYSQGGRIALHLAAHHPRLVKHVVAVSASLGITDAAERATRRRADAALAERIERIGLETFLDEWSRHPLVGTEHFDPSLAETARRIRRGNSAAGLAAALRGMGQGRVPALSPEEIPCPVTWVAGARDVRYRTLGEQAAAAMGGDLHIVAGAGHNVVLEAPHALARLVDRVLSAAA